MIKVWWSDWGTDSSFVVRKISLRDTEVSLRALPTDSSFPTAKRQSDLIRYIGRCILGLTVIRSLK